MTENDSDIDPKFAAILCAAHTLLVGAGIGTGRTYRTTASQFVPTAHLMNLAKACEALGDAWETVRTKGPGTVNNRI